MNFSTLEYIQSFYKDQPNQILNINKIQKWFNDIENNKINSLLIVGNIGIGKTNIINIFSSQSKSDIIHISKLFDVYESNKSYTVKDFIPKILKQKYVGNYEDINRKKIIIVDSLEEFIEIQKSVIRDIIENLDNLNIPFVFVCDKNSFENLEKKILTKLKKCVQIIELEKPTLTTLNNYILNILKLKMNKEDIEKLAKYSKGDMRFLNNTIQFQNIIKSSKCLNVKENTIIQDNTKDIEIEVESVLKEIGSQQLSISFSKCETDPFIFGMLTYENYIYNNPKYPEKKRSNIIELLSLGDQIEKKLFKYQQWELLDVYSFYSTIYPWKLLENPKNINPSTTLQKFLNTKKKNKKYDLPF